MKIFLPQIIYSFQSGPVACRGSKAIFVRKHDLEVNLDAVKLETGNISKSKIDMWLFVVEGYKKYNSRENKYLDNYVELSGVKAEDPVIAPFTAKIAELASVEKVAAALSILTMDYFDFLDELRENKLSESQIQSLFYKSVNILAEAFDTNPESIMREFNKLKWHDSEALSKEIILLSKIRMKLIDESNSQSRKQLNEILNDNRQPNLFIMSGIEHATIFSQ